MVRVGEPNVRLLMAIIVKHNNGVPIEGNYIEISFKGDPRSVFYVEVSIGKIITHKSKPFMY